MSLPTKRRRQAGGGALLATLLLALGLTAPAARAAVPTIGQVWSSAVFSTTARLSAQVNPNGLFTSFHFDYITKAAYDANVAASKEPFEGAARTPAASDANIGSGTTFATALQLLSGLKADTAYRYRVVAKNSTGTTPSAAFAFVTQPTGGGSVLADGRGWEMVSPIDKNGGQMEQPGTLFGGGVLQAAAQGNLVTYGSRASFGADAKGAPTASQYVSTRTASGWSIQNITAPIISGSYHSPDEGVPYQLFSGDLARGLLFNGDHCRGEGSECAVANPPLAGTDAPAGYQNYYLREGEAFTALLGAVNAGFLTLDPAYFDLRFAGASADLRHPVLSTCAALTVNATEVPAGEGCDPTKPNLYEWSGGALALVNANPGAELAAQGGAVSADGSRVYFTEGGSLYLREGAQTKLLATGAQFQTASTSGGIAFYTGADEHLYRYEAAGAGSSTDLTPSGGVAGVLGAAENGSHLYYLNGGGLYLCTSADIVTSCDAVATKVANDADPSNYPPATGTARVSADGTRLLFVSSVHELSGYDNTDLASSVECGESGGVCDSQVYLYDTGAGLTCVSCNPTNERPVGASSIPGAVANGTAVGSTDSYKPRVLSADGRRVFFDSRDVLVLTDTNNGADAYEWEAQGEGSCTRAGGCVTLISSGRSAGVNAFVDASADGVDAFFLTEGSLVNSDPGALDLYDARIGGGFPEPQKPIPCEGDACQSLPPQPVDPTLTTLLSGPGNPGVRYPKQKRCKKGFVRRKGKCVRKKKARSKKHGARRRVRRGR